MLLPSSSTKKISLPEPFPKYWRSFLICCLIQLGLVVVIFSNVLFSGGTQVLGSQDTDLFDQFIAWRQFGFGELSKGHLVLWNPHVYAGAPYFGGFQAALLYPLNLIFLILPLPMAINWSIALHVFLIGGFMNLWAYRRGLQPGAACLAGILTMFSGAFFLHIYAGHLTNLCAMTWAPLIFLAIDELFFFFEKSDGSIHEVGGWCLLGAGAVAMQILAGHPQYVFYTGIAAGAYSLLRMVGAKKRGATLACLITIPLAGTALTTVQWLTGLQASSETIRHKVLPFEFASKFSLPPENFLTLIAPGFFGELSSSKYFGRCDLWEMSLFIGVTGLMLAIYGTLPQKATNLMKEESQKEKRKPNLKTAPATKAVPTIVRPSFLDSKLPILMIVMLLLLALGIHTPLFHFLYSYVPGFNKFRGISKFIFPATLFISLLSAMGFDRLLTSRPQGKKAPIILLSISGALFLFSFLVRIIDWQPVLSAFSKTGESNLSSQLFVNPDLSLPLKEMAELARKSAANALLISGFTAFVLGGLLLGMIRKHRMVWAIGVLALLEVLVFAYTSRTTFDSRLAASPEIQAFLNKHPGDYRIINKLNPNSAAVFGAQDIAGNDPSVVGRYAEFVAFTQGRDPDLATQILGITQIHPLFAMLRLRYGFILQNGRVGTIEFPTPLSHVTLVGGYQVIEKRQAIFTAMSHSTFDPHTTVILEQEPSPRPSAQNTGSARIVAQTTDSLIIEADTSHPSILLISDLYTPSWRAVPMPGSAQSHYKIIPANYILRAIPLQAGSHKIRVEYRPQAFIIGTWISLLALIIYIGLTVWWIRHKK